MNSLELKGHIQAKGSFSLTEISFSDHQPTRTTIEVDHKLPLNKTEEKVDIGRYQRLVRKLIY